MAKDDFPKFEDEPQFPKEDELVYEDPEGEVRAVRRLSHANPPTLGAVPWFTLQFKGFTPEGHADLQVHMSGWNDDDLVDILMHGLEAVARSLE